MRNRDAPTNYQRASIQLAAAELARELRDVLNLAADEQESLALAVEHRVLDVVRDVANAR